MDTSGLPDMYTGIPRVGLKDEGVYIRLIISPQITTVCNTKSCMGEHQLKLTDSGARGT